MQVSENFESPLDARETRVFCPHCSQTFIVYFPYEPTAIQRLELMKEAIDEHRRLCPSAPPEEGRVMRIDYPRKH